MIKNISNAPKRHAYNTLDGAFAFSLTIAMVVLISLVVQILSMGEELSTALQLTAMAMFQVSFLNVWWLYSRQKNISLSAVALNKPTLRGWIFTVCLSLAIVAAGTVLERGLYALADAIGYKITEIALSPVELGVFAVITIVLAPICEELIFRGMILRSLKKLGATAAILLSAGLFAIFHSSPEQTLYQFLFGLALGLVALKTNSVFPAMLAHLISNGLVFARLYTTTVFDYVLWGVGGAALIAVIVLLKLGGLKSESKNPVKASTANHAPTVQPTTAVSADNLTQEGNQDNPAVTPIESSTSPTESNNQTELNNRTEQPNNEGCSASTTPPPNAVLQEGFAVSTALVVMVYLLGIGVTIIQWIMQLITNLQG